MRGRVRPRGEPQRRATAMSRSERSVTCERTSVHATSPLQSWPSGGEGAKNTSVIGASTMRDTARIQTHALFCSLLVTPYSRAHVGTVTSRMGGGHRFGRTHRRMSTRTCTLLLHTSRVDYSSTLYRDLPRSTERYGADTDSESDAEELTRTCQSRAPAHGGTRRARLWVKGRLRRNLGRMATCTAPAVGCGQSELAASCGGRA